eukprot:3741444-Ditylum_brightwellii.AAC.1
MLQVPEDGWATRHPRRGTYDNQCTHTLVSDVILPGKNDNLGEDQQIYNTCLGGGMVGLQCCLVIKQRNFFCVHLPSVQPGIVHHQKSSQSKAESQPQSVH